MQVLSTHLGHCRRQDADWPLVDQGQLSLGLLQGVLLHGQAQGVGLGGLVMLQLHAWAQLGTLPLGWEGTPRVCAAADVAGSRHAPGGQALLDKAELHSTHALAGRQPGRSSWCLQFRLQQPASLLGAGRQPAVQPCLQVQARLAGLLTSRRQAKLADGTEPVYPVTAAQSPE